MSRPRGLSFDAMAVALLFVVVTVGAALTVAQADTFWNLRAGQDLWRSGHVPRVDTYSYTAAGRDWPDHEWLWQAGAYLLYRAGGFPLLTAAAAATIVAAVAVGYALMQGAARARFALLLLAIPLGSLVWTLRPQLVTLLALPALTWLLVHDRVRWLPPLFLLWANAHGGVALGGAVLVVVWVGAWLRARGAAASDADRARVRRLGVAVPLCALATAATPLGFGIFRFVLTSEERLRDVGVSEWMPFESGSRLAVASWLLAAGFAIVLARRWRSLRDGAWGDWACVGAALALYPFALRSVRHLGPWLLLAPAAVSRLLGPAFLGRATRSAAEPDHPALNAAIMAVAGVAAVVAVAVSWTLPLPHLGWTPLSPGVVAAVRSCPGPLYNHYDQGGYLIWFVPERRVFIDSRQDPYPSSLLLEHRAVEAGAASPDALFARYAIRCSFLPTTSPTVAALAREGWRSLYRDEKWAVQAAPR
jgi:hypothetical protein